MKAHRTSENSDQNRLRKQPPAASGKGDEGKALLSPQESRLNNKTLAESSKQKHIGVSNALAKDNINNMDLKRQNEATAVVANKTSGLSSDRTISRLVDEQRGDQKTMPSWTDKQYDVNQNRMNHEYEALRNNQMPGRSCEADDQASAGADVSPAALRSSCPTKNTESVRTNVKSPLRSSNPISPVHMQALNQSVQQRQQQKLQQLQPQQIHLSSAHQQYTVSPFVNQFTDDSGWSSSTNVMLQSPISQLPTAMLVISQFPTPPSTYSCETPITSYPSPRQYLTLSPDSPGQWSSSSPQSAQSDWSMNSPTNSISFAKTQNNAKGEQFYM